MNRRFLIFACLQIMSSVAAYASYDAGIAALQVNDISKAVAEFQAGAADGDYRAQYSLAMLYERGIGVEKSEREALDWYKKASAQGDKRALEAIIRLRWPADEMGRTSQNGQSEKLIEFDEDIKKMVRLTGIPADKMSALRSIGERRGVEFEEMATGLVHFSRILGEIWRQHSQASMAYEAAKARRFNPFARLNVKIYGANGDLRPDADILRETCDSLYKMTDESLKLSIATQIWDKDRASRILKLLRDQRFSKNGYRGCPWLANGTDIWSEFYSSILSAHQSEFEIQFASEMLASLENPLSGIGVAAVDSNGRARNILSILYDVSDRLHAMPPGPKKITAMMDLFGPGNLGVNVGEALADEGSAAIRK